MSALAAAPVRKAARRRSADRRPGVAATTDPAAALRHLRRALRWLADARLDQPDKLRRARRAIRRLRLLLSLFRAAVGERRRQRIDQSLRSLSHRLGRLRDWDVLRANLGDEPELIEAIDERRRKAVKRVHRRLAGACCQTLDGELKTAGRRLRRSTEVESASQSALEHRWQRFRQQLLKAEVADAESLHALRRQLRKLRQTGRWSAAWLALPLPRSWMPTLKQAQALLGRVHDDQRMQALLAKLDVPPTLSPVVHDRPDVRQIDDCLQRLRRLPQPWVG